MRLFFRGLHKKRFGFSTSVLRRCIAVIYRDTPFLTEVVKDELRYSLEHSNVNPKIIKEKLIYIWKMLLMKQLQIFKPLIKDFMLTKPAWVNKLLLV